MIKLTSDDIKILATFERMTGVQPGDVLLADDWVAFLVGEGEAGKAIGKGGMNIARVRDAFSGKSVFIIESNDEPAKFARNLFSNVRVSNIKESGSNNSRTIVVTVDSRDRGNAIGRGGERIKMARALMSRHFPNTELRLESRD